MSAPVNAYAFGCFVLDLSRGALRLEGRELALRPKSFTLLRYLVKRAGHLVDRNEIMEAVWPGVAVTEASIDQCIRDIRRALRDDSGAVVRTVPRRGYRFDEPVVARNSPDTAAREPMLPVGRPVVEVRDFVDLGGAREMAYFAKGLTADLITDLTRFQDFQTIGPRARNELPPNGPLHSGQVAPLYRVDGSVQRTRGRIRVTAQLEDRRTGVCIWAERFDRPLDDVLALQEDLADHFAALIEDRIGRESLRTVRRRAPATFSAYDWLLQGRALHGRATEADNDAARRMFDRAIDADDNYATAYACQSFVAQRGFTLNWGHTRGRGALDLAHKLSQYAVSLEPSSPLCLMRHAFVLSLLGRDEEAVQGGRIGILANPCDATNRHTYGEILSRAGLHEAGVAELRRAISLNPYHPPFWRATLGRALLLAGERNAALAELRLGRALAPDYRPVHSSLVVAFAESGLMNEARTALREVLRLRPGWTIAQYDGEFGLRRPEDTDRFLAAFRAAGMPER